jgi:hypothetical protein
MPRLLTFLACQSVTADEKTNAISLHHVLQEFRVNIPYGTSAPPVGLNVVMDWAVFSIWEKESADAGKTFDVRWRIVFGDELLFEGAAATFKLEKATQQVVSIVNTFPVWRQGTCRLVLSVGESRQTKFSDVASYPVYVYHDAAPAVPS